MLLLLEEEYLEEPRGEGRAKRDSRDAASAADADAGRFSRERCGRAGAGASALGELGLCRRDRSGAKGKREALAAAARRLCRQCHWQQPRK